MTVSITTSRVQYAGDGIVTSFIYPFKIYEDDDLRVVKTDAEGFESDLSLNTHYTVNGAGDESGGTITLLSALYLDSGETMTLIRDIDLTQETDFVDGQATPAATLELPVDKSRIIDQQFKEELDRTLRLPILGTVTSLLTPPEALKFFRWNSDGTAIEYISAGSVDLAVPADGSVTSDKLAGDAAIKIDATNITQLRGKQGVAGAIAYIKGYNTDGDGGEGLFYWDSTSTETDNGGTIIKVTAVVTGRWLRFHSDTINVEWFGAKGDVIHISDGAITATSQAFTSASNPFVATDVGKLIIVGGAGAAGEDLSTSISAYVSAGEVTLTDAAVTTVVDVSTRFGTDDRLPIQAAVDVKYNAGVAPSGGSVELSDFAYMVGGVGVELFENVHFIGVNGSSSYKEGVIVGGSWLVCAGTTNGITVDGSFAGFDSRRNIHIKNINIDVNSNMDAGLYTDFMTQFEVENLQVRGNSTYGWRKINSYGGTVHNFWAVGEKTYACREEQNVADSVFTGQTHYTRCRFNDSTYGYYSDNEAGNVMSQILHSDCHYKSNDYGMYTAGGDGPTVVEGHFEANLINDAYSAPGSRSPRILSFYNNNGFTKTYSFHYEGSKGCVSNGKCASHDENTVDETGSIGTGTNTLTLSAAGDFADDDNITIAGAGVASADLTTTIVSGGGTVNIVLADNASTTVAGAAIIRRTTVIRFDGDGAVSDNVVIRQKSLIKIRAYYVSGIRNKISNPKFETGTAGAFDAVYIGSNADATHISNISEDDTAGAIVTDNSDSTVYDDAFTINFPEFNLISGSDQRYPYYINRRLWLNRAWLIYGVGPTAMDITVARVRLNRSQAAGDESIGLYMAYDTVDGQSKFTRVNLHELGEIDGNFIEQGESIIAHCDGAGTDSGAAEGEATLIIELTPYRAIT